MESEGNLPRRAVLIVNTKSRRGREWFAGAQQELVDRGVTLERAMKFRTVDELRSEVRSAIEQKVPLVIVGGGDGTFSAIARYFVGSESILGVLPLGTGNAFARDLGIPANLASACKTLTEGCVSSIDLGIAAGDYFVNIATVGLTTRIAQALTVPLKRRYGRLVYAIALVRGLRRVMPFQATITTENGTTTFDTLQVVIGNGRFHAGPFPLSPTASITEGRLSLYALKTTRKSAFLKMALFLPSGQHVNLDDVFSEECIGGKLTTMPPMATTVDGEVCSRTPFEFGVVRSALQVITPVEFGCMSQEPLSSQV